MAHKLCDTCYMEIPLAAIVCPYCIFPFGSRGGRGGGGITLFDIVATGLLIWGFVWFYHKVYG
jgi:hypothetical protein